LDEEKDIYVYNIKNQEEYENGTLAYYLQNEEGYI